MAWIHMLQKITHPLLACPAHCFDESCFVWYHQKGKDPQSSQRSSTTNPLSSSSPTPSPKSLLIQQPSGWPTLAPQHWALHLPRQGSAPGEARRFSRTYAELLGSAVHTEPSLASLAAQAGANRASCCSHLAHAPTFSSKQSMWCQEWKTGSLHVPIPLWHIISTVGICSWDGVGWTLQQRPPWKWSLKLLPLVLPTTSAEIASFVQDSNPWLLLSAYQHTLLLFLERKIVWHIVLERLPAPHLH